MRTEKPVKRNRSPTVDIVATLDWMMQEQGPDGGLSSCSLRALFFANYIKRPNCPKIDTVSLIHFALNRSSREKYLVRGPESDPPPPSGIFADMYHFKASPKGIWKMHVCTWLVGGCGCAATFFSSAKSHRLPTPRGELTFSETPLPTKITLKVI